MIGWTVKLKTNKTMKNLIYRCRKICTGSLFIGKAIAR